MSYQVLARKLRPADFDSLVGQEHVVRALRHGLDNDRLHHAYLFTGTRGVGKTTIGRLLAKCLNCETGVSSTPCGTCSACREIAENRFVDLIEVDAASRTGVSDTRELLENAQYLPTRGRYKVYLIDEVHMLSTAAFNALLKTLEEPPEHVKFLLATTDPKKVPVTVLSRCLQFQLKNIPRDKIAAYLVKVLTDEDVEFETEAVDIIADAAQGSMRDALSITDQAVAHGGGRLLEDELVAMLGIAGRDRIGALLGALADQDAGKVLAITRELADRAADFEDLLASLLAALHHEAVNYATGGQPTHPLSAEVVQLYYQIALMGYRDIHIVPDPRSGFEMTLLRMLAFTPDAGAGRALASESDDAPVAAPAPALTNPPRVRAADPVPGPTESAGDAARQVIGGEPWHGIVASLELNGVARMIAEHSILGAVSGDALELVLDKAHDTLLNDAQRRSIEQALAARLDRKIDLRIVMADVTEETPARRRERLRAERQHEAVRALEDDHTVRSLLSEFGGRLDGVTPVEDSAG